MENGVEKVMDTCTRRPHKKSRNGCGRCKKRKIKCDERKPVCTNCAKHSVECDLTQRHSTTPWSSPAQFSPFASTSPHDSHSTPHTPYSTGERIEDGQEIPALNMLDLELLHHFCTSTCRTLHGDSTQKAVWQINVPKIAFSHDFVMRGILALSALHLAKFKPDRREFLLSQATAYHQLALRKATAVLPHKTDENCSALYLFSSLVFIFALGSPKNPADFLVLSNSGIADWLVLFRGSRFLIESSHAVLEKGPLALMFIEGGKRASLMEQLSQHEMPLDEQIDELRRLVEKASNPEECEVYAKSIDDLRKSYCIVYSRESPGIEIADVFIWVFRITDEYLLLLHERKQEALVIFAYFCVILKRLEGNWWVHGWSSHLMARIHHVLDEEHRLSIRWPMEEIGWIPA